MKSEHIFKEGEHCYHPVYGRSRFPIKELKSDDHSNYPIEATFVLSDKRTETLNFTKDGRYFQGDYRPTIYPFPIDIIKL